MRYADHIREWSRIKRNQWLKPQELQVLQEEALTRLMAHAYNNVPYYRELFDSIGFTPPGKMTLKDLTNIPVLTKDDIVRNYPHNILAKGFDSSACSARMTSGSSGRKLEVVLDDRVAALYRLMQYRQLIDIGYKPWHTIAYVRFSAPVTNIALQRLNLFRRAYIPLEWEPERQVSEIMRLKPQAINAYPSVLFLLARAIGKKDAGRLGLRFILSNSELLTDHVRTYCEEKFGCKVYDDYSCLEFSAIAAECRVQNLHIASDNVIVEVLEVDGSPAARGTAGKIVVTALNNYSMPYIRYEIGDVGALSDSDCQCGRGFPLLKSIMGRCDDFLVMPDGKWVDPQTVVFQIETIPEVKEFRVVQQEDHAIDVTVVPEGPGYFPGIRDQITMKLKMLFNGSVPVTVYEAEILERGSTGKHRSIFSRAPGASPDRPGDAGS